MSADDPNARPTQPMLPPAGSPDLTRTFSDPSSTLPFVPAFAPIPVDAWPSSLTRYQPLHLIGDGGMGEVYLAHDTQLDRQVAIKFARLGRGREADTADRILAEARAAARLHHAGICPVFDADVCDGVPYLTMAFVQGPTLAAELKRLGPCPPRYAAKLVLRVAEAMRYAHDSGVIHRDLKPANILLTPEHDPVVTDFGLAVRLDRDGPVDAAVAGTPHYMAPEQWAGDAAHIGERTDVFALGVILFEMLTGRVPFDGTAREVREKVQSEPIPPVRKLRPDVPPELARIVAKATARNPAARYPTMAAFAAALANTRTLQQDNAPKTRAFEWAGWLAIAAVAVLAIGILACGFGLFLPAIQKLRNAADKLSGMSEEDERVVVLTREGEGFEAAGLFAEAEGKYDEALTVNPNAAATRQLRGKLRERQGRLAEALADFDAVVEQVPDMAEWRRNRAAVLMKLGRHKDALVDLDAADRLPSESVDTYTLRGEAYLELKEYAKAQTDLTRAIKKDKENANAFFLRGRARGEQGDTTGRDADWAEAAKRSGKLDVRFLKLLTGVPAPPAPPTPGK